MQLQTSIKSTNRPFVIAGPCSIETEEQLFSVVRDLSKNPMIKMIRGGIWKPRTRPDSFEGIGAIGLPWIQAVKKEISLPFCIEVATPKHVEAALNAGIDALWIGARTTVNPFAVQDIVDALKGAEIPILIKNPVNPDVLLWIGAFERFQNAGLTDLTAVHRGFSIYSHPKYRNVPDWEIPIAFKEHFPDIPLINDPSHIGGNRQLILEIAQKAMDLDFDGLMIETHPQPEKAWSDSKQQVTPTDLQKILQQLVLRNKSEVNYETQLFQFREVLRQLDDEVFNILAKRMAICNEIGDFKRENNLTILSVNHWKKVVQERLENASEEKLSATFIRSLLDAIHQESIRHQNQVMNKNLHPND